MRPWKAVVSNEPLTSTMRWVVALAKMQAVPVGESWVTTVVAMVVAVSKLRWELSGRPVLQG